MTTFKQSKRDMNMLDDARVAGSIDYDNFEALEEIVLGKMRELIQQDLPDDLKAVAPKTNNICVDEDELKRTMLHHKLREQDEVYCLSCSSVFPAAFLRREYDDDGSFKWHQCCVCDKGYLGIDLRVLISQEHPNWNQVHVDEQGRETQSGTEEQFAMGCLLQWDITLEQARRQGYLGIDNKTNSKAKN